MTSLQNLQYSLYNLDNYKPTISSSIEDIINKYNMLISEYIKIKPSYNFIIGRGLDTISHVFLLMLYNTKNVDMSYYHSQKAFYFYIEFIEQITGDVNCLKLSSTDAMLFVYKKTIFELNPKNTHPIQDKDKQLLEYLNKYIIDYKQNKIK